MLPRFTVWRYVMVMAAYAATHSLRSDRFHAAGPLLTDRATTLACHAATGPVLWPAILFIDARMLEVTLRGLNHTEHGTRANLFD